MPASRRRPPHVYNIEPAITPPPANNWINMLGGNVPLTFVISALVGIAVWYGTSNSEQKQSREEIARLNTRLEDVTKTTAVSSKEQDERRAAMAKEFLASNKEIANKVGELAVSLAVQKETQKATSDALVKISDQLQQLNSRSNGRK